MDNKRVLLVDGGSALTSNVPQLVRDGGGAVAGGGAVDGDATIVMHAEQRAPNFRERNEEIDRKWVGRIRARMRKAEARKDKDRNGCLRIEYKGSVRVKLTKQYGGKRARRILNAERRTAREYPGELRLWEIANVPIGRDPKTNDIITEKHERELARGVDFALVIDGGDISLVIDDSVKEFRAESALNDGALAGMLGT